MSWTSDQARSLADKILSFSKAAECEVSLGLSRTGNTRFAANEITTGRRGPQESRSRSRAARGTSAARRHPTSSTIHCFATPWPGARR